ncbi:hypothetical protein [Mesoplasma florum]|uniref:hypothetical protein n=1 Tax=Mesoplasma florum TaxID=2151 RepID=UPI000D043EE3|nr:hypothetical protein [Mesoplasma florum]AVN59289.1 hypothetical protein CG009_00075 [Mesoplasma florum]
MKKLLLTLSSILMIGTTSMSVVSCGVKPEKNVIFAIIGGPTQSSGDLEKVTAYKEIADEYNELNKGVEGFVPVKVQWKDSNYLNNTIMVGDNLPDLYISYVDAASTYLSTKVGSKVRDMEVSMGEEGFESFKNDLITPAFMDEGKYQDKQIVLPFGKSFDISVINVNTWIQFVAHVDGYKESAEALQIAFNNFNKNERKLELGGDTETSNNQIFDSSLKINVDEKWVKDNNISDADFEKLKLVINECLETAGISNGKIAKENGDVQKAIKDVFAKTENVILLTKFMNAIVHTNGAINVKIANRDAISVNGEFLNDCQLKEVNKSTGKLDYTQAKNYGFGIDSVDNKFFMDYASSSTTPQELINIEDPNNEFWYSSTFSPNKTKINLNENSKSFIETTEFLDAMKDIAKSNNNSSALSFPEQWNGVMSVARYDTPNVKSWITSDFIKGTMFMGSASSANDPYFAQQQKKVDDEIDLEGKKVKATTYFSPNKKADLLTAPKSNKENFNRHVFMSQGRGIAGFKSNGKNKDKKEESVTGFLNYMMQPKPAARFALRTSYLPATKSGMEIYKNYVNGSYNNKTGIVEEGRKNLEDAVRVIEGLGNQDVSDEQIYKYFSQIQDAKGNPDPKATVSPVMTGLINEYLEPKIQSEKNIEDYSANEEVTLLVSSKAIPTTDIMRSSLKSSIDPNNGVMDLKNWGSIRFSDILKPYEDRKNNYLIEKWILSNQSEFFRNIEITRNKNNIK